MKNKLQPTRTTFSRNFQCKKALHWLSKLFHFGTENRADQLKKTPCTTQDKAPKRSDSKLVQCGGPAHCRVLNTITKLIVAFFYSFVHHHHHQQHDNSKGYFDLVGRQQVSREFWTKKQREVFTALYSSWWSWADDHWPWWQWWQFHDTCKWCVASRRWQLHEPDEQMLQSKFWMAGNSKGNQQEMYPCTPKCWYIRYITPMKTMCRVAELGSLSSGAKMAMKIFVKRVFSIFATNASFLRVIANLQI